MSFKRVLPLVLAAAVACFVVSCGSDAQKTVDITKVTTLSGTSPKAGPVKFPHDVHDVDKMKCAKCHHKEYNDERVKVCADCHVGDAGMETIHNLCYGCHLSVKDGPRECSGCHGTLAKE